MKDKVDCFPRRHRGQKLSLISVSVAPLLYSRAKGGRSGLAAQTTMCRRRPGKNL